MQDFYMNLPRLETKNLVLRKATIRDAAEIFGYSSDREVTRFLRWGPHQIIKDTEKYINAVLEQYQADQDGPWAIEYKFTGVVIGHIHLMELDEQPKKAQVGFVLSRNYWNKGIMTEALGKVLEYSFYGLRLNRMEAMCIRENRAAARVLEKAGMRKEGELPGYLFQKGKYWDFQLYAVLRDEFLQKEST